MSAVVDSGPLISLAAVGQVDRLREQCGEILVVPAVAREVIDEGQGRVGEAELRAALTAGWARRVPAPDQTLVERLRRPALALTDSEVLACAVAHGCLLVVTDDAPLRRLALEEELPLVGTVGVLMRARLDGRLPVLKPLLDQLVTSGLASPPFDYVKQGPNPPGAANDVTYTLSAGAPHMTVFGSADLGFDPAVGFAAFTLTDNVVGDSTGDDDRIVDPGRPGLPGRGGTNPGPGPGSRRVGHARFAARPPRPRAPAAALSRRMELSGALMPRYVVDAPVRESAGNSRLSPQPSDVLRA